MLMAKMYAHKKFVAASVAETPSAARQFVADVIPYGCVVYNLIGTMQTVGKIFFHF